MPQTSPLGVQLHLEEKGNTNWNCHHSVPFVPGKWQRGRQRGKQWGGSSPTMGVGHHGFSCLGLGEGVWVQMICPSLFLLFTTRAWTLPFAIFFFVSGATWIKLWCSHLESDSVSIFACNHPLLYIVVISIVAVFVFLMSLLTLFSKFLSQPIISTFIPLLLAWKESSCLEFKTFRNYGI